jgi:hypothetical protein
MLWARELAGTDGIISSQAHGRTSMTTIARQTASARTGLVEGPREVDKDLKKKHENESDDPFAFLLGAFCRSARLQKASESLP